MLRKWILSGNEMKKSKLPKRAYWWYCNNARVPRKPGEPVGFMLAERRCKKLHGECAVVGCSAIKVKVKEIPYQKRER